MSESCNKQVVKETVTQTGESKALIEHVIGHYMGFTAGRIKEGAFESVRIPGFGTFRAKVKYVQWRSYFRSLPEGYRKIIRGK